MIEKIRFVIDTNILLDIVYFNDDRIQKLKGLLESNALEVWSCESIWEEFLDVLKRPLFYSDESSYLEMVRKAREYFQFENQLIPKSTYKCRDKDDQIFIDLAVLKAPCWLISRDLEVLRLAKKLLAIGVKVVKATDLDLSPPLP